MKLHEFTESMTCSECGGPAFTDLILAEKKDACYSKVRSRYKVWPSAYASGALVQCRKKGAANWGNSSKNEDVVEGPNDGKEDNFTIDDIKNLERIRDFETLKAQAKELIKGKPARRMKPEKISWFYNHIDTLKNPLAVIKMMYDLMLAGEGNKVIGSRNSMSANSYRSKFGEQDVAEDDVDEGLGSKLAGLGLAGAMALGSAGANARVTPDGQGGFTGGMKPSPTVTAPAPTRIDSPSGPSGFSKEYLQKAADPNRTGRYMISIEKAQELLKQTNEGTARLPDPNDFDSDWEYQDALDAYGKTQDADSDFENIADEPDDWFDESKEKVGNMDADDFDAAMARLKKLAGAGPMRTVYDPQKRVYRNMPTAQQPARQPKK